MDFDNVLRFATPNGLSVDDMNKSMEEIKDRWDIASEFESKEIIVGVSDGIVEFLYDNTYFEQNVRIIFEKSGTAVSVTSDCADACISIYHTLCELDWGWIEV